MKNFVSPHVHIASFDAASSAEQFAKRETELGTGYITITDHGTLEGTRSVYDLCAKGGKYNGKLKPILGLEGYFRDDNDPILVEAGAPRSKDGTFREHFKYCHLTLHALDEGGYSALSRVLSAADLRAEKHGSERKPLFTWENLEDLGGHNVTVTSGCLIGMVGRHLLKNNDPMSAMKYYQKLRSSFKPGNFYVEIFPHVCDKYWESKVVVTVEGGQTFEYPMWRKVKTKHSEEGIKIADLANAFSNNAKARKTHQEIVEIMLDRKWTQPTGPMVLMDVQKKEGWLQNECQPWAPDGDVQLGVNKFILRMAQMHGDPVLLSDDSHFAYPEERVVQNIRLSQDGSWTFANSHHRLTSADAWAYCKDRLGADEAQFEGWVDNTHAWASRFNDFKFNSRKTLPTSFYPAQTLEHTLQLIKKHGRMDWNNKEWVDRLGAEINLLYKNGVIDLLPYFQIDEEVVLEYVRAVQLPGPGRGSAAGLLLANLLGITHIDPLKFKLSMDRFMTPDRIADGKLPDIDQDLPSRELLVGTDEGGGWLHKRFGDHVAQISTNSTMKLKSAIKDTFRALAREAGDPYPRVPEHIEAFCKALPNPPQGIPDREYIFGYKDSDGNPIPGFLETSKELQQFIKDHPRQWDVIQMLLGLPRSRSRHACFVGGTKILTVVDDTKIVPTAIENCHGKKVLTGQGNVVEAQLLNPGFKEVFEFSLSNGTTITCTADHRLLTTQGWETASEILIQGLEIIENAGQIIIGNRSMKITSARYIGRRQVWDLHVDHPDHSFLLESHIVAHNSAYVIADEPIYNFIPLQTIGGVRVTSFTANAVEAAGGLKMDFLVVNSLKDIDSAIKLIRQRYLKTEWQTDEDGVRYLTVNNKKIEEVFVVKSPAGAVEHIWNLPEDNEVFHDICNSKVETVFQFDAAAARQGLKHFSPDDNGNPPLKSIEDLAVFTALDRPGPLDAYVEDANGNKHNMLVEYARRARGMSATGGFEILDRLLPETLGVLVYQEQLQYIFQTVGKTTGIEANTFRQRIGKKKMAEVLKKDRPLFMKGAVESIGPENAERLWDSMATFGQYGFNKSHAVCYVTIAYACAWLKHYYPLEWWTAVLTNATRDDIDEKFWRHCGSLIALPDIKMSKSNFTIEGDIIRAPLTLLKGLGDKAHEQLVGLGTDYNTIEEFLQKIEDWKIAHPADRLDKKTGEVKKVKGRSAINSTIIQKLIISGAMDSVFPANDAAGLPMTIEDKLTAYVFATKKVAGKKVVSMASKINLMSPLVRLQFRKQILPAFAEPMLPIAQKCFPEMFRDKIFCPPYSPNDRNEESRIVTGKEYEYLGGLGPIEAELNVGMIGYVIAERKFEYTSKKTGESKRACELTLDVDGIRMQIVKWPSKDGLPRAFDADLTGSVVVCSFWRGSGGDDFFFSNLTVIAPPIQPAEEEESK